MEISRKMNRKSNLQPVRCTSCKVTSPETQLNHNDVQVETFSAQTFHSRKKKESFWQSTGRGRDRGVVRQEPGATPILVYQHNSRFNLDK